MEEKSPSLLTHKTLHDLHSSAMSLLQPYTVPVRAVPQKEHLQSFHRSRRQTYRGGIRIYWLKTPHLHFSRSYLVILECNIQHISVKLFCGWQAFQTVIKQDV